MGIILTLQAGLVGFCYAQPRFLRLSHQDLLQIRVHFKLLNISSLDLILQSVLRIPSNSIELNHIQITSYRTIANTFNLYLEYLQTPYS